MNGKIMFSALFLSLLLVFGCGSDEEGIVGIWRVKSSKVEGREIGDGKGWFHFHAEGKVDTRPRPGSYQSGKYTIDPDKGKIHLTNDNGELTYDYKLSGDALQMSATMPNGMPLELDCERVDDYPITKENDVESDQPVFTPG